VPAPHRGWTSRLIRDFDYHSPEFRPTVVRPALVGGDVIRPQKKGNDTPPLFHSRETDGSIRESSRSRRTTQGQRQGCEAWPKWAHREKAWSYRNAPKDEHSRRMFDFYSIQAHLDAAIAARLTCEVALLLMRFWESDKQGDMDGHATVWDFLPPTVLMLPLLPTVLLLLLMVIYRVFFVRLKFRRRRI
jgi:hypothetical protein